jgi:hypothetical protein
MPHGRGLSLVGARARLSIGNKVMMYCTNVTYGEEITQEPIEALDNILVSEHVATRMRVNFSAQWVRVITNSIKLKDGVAIWPQVEDVLSQGELTATIEDKVTNAVLANIQRVKASRYNVNIGASGIVMSDVEFVAISIRDESEVV